MSIDTHTNRETQSLTALAVELNARVGVRAEVSVIDRAAPFLKATNRTTPLLTEQITVTDDHYRWSWGESIGPVSDPGSAAAQVVKVIRDR
ncbi:hypothetical protein [Actinomadura sp. HBU206391]|uniref:hypothetical protein n=1 Tax=Actinomadura sp. HBU206391 TaxID=2731692 RepID=UPI0016503420|nr:hypothetical protein [Actinomadura sp. HBU206391]MBC6457986.1 hypothetical protein [Actinomadura sp. HBU206391]